MLPTYVSSVSNLATAASLTLPSVSYQSGDVLVMCVLHRSALTVPTGWALQVTVGPNASDTNTQQTSILTCTMSSAGSVAQVIFQASALRLVAALLVFRNVTSVTARLDLSQEAGAGVREFTTGLRGNDNATVWAISSILWSYPRIWMAQPTALRGVMWPTQTSTDPARLGVFYDKLPDGARTIGTPVSDPGFTYLAALEIVGSTDGSGDLGDPVLEYDSSQWVPDSFEHVMEPTAAFPEAIARDADEIVLDGVFEHVMEPTGDFGSDFTGVYFGPW